MRQPETFPSRLASMVEARLPVRVESDGSQDEWQIVGPAILAAATKHLRAIEHLQDEFGSAVIGWQLVRTMFEYAVTFGWVAGDPETRTKRWLKYDYDQRRKLDDDLVRLGADPVLDQALRAELLGYEPESSVMPNIADRAREADEAWAAPVEQLLDRLEGELPADWRSFRLQYVWIYRNGSRFTHPSSHVVQAFTSGRPPSLEVGAERPSERDLALIATFMLAFALSIAASALPAIGVSLDDVVSALS